ncbi:winged helix-turn-helix domain-containing protein [Bradyrhizobium sp. AUGA SZCCT0431]|uniref:winged helix-turn-helix domain-containing protein n=1 Tax=Bradyrhizobium sp. AUGA SZCCT0431 TaxID=2807674 RepID=UPI001BA5356B|nr:winged helix-turn-helix domain-containing protein [Bradyrhizobium sp. AUGA SZCCT0431]MBR1147497.1 winged helix-turn-helix domain-containing protein [Bradyrhizobium sp. AUGA SZCCT0431]
MRYLFEQFAFDTDRRELRRGADVVPVAPQVFDLLDYLIRNRQRVVSKDDLIGAIWNGRIVSDAALTTRLNIARSLIGDTGSEQRLIKTLPRKGFRFVGPVLEAHEPSGEAIADNPAEPSKVALALPDKPSIAVLPFQNMSGDPEQEYFADGMAEDILTGLSRHRWLFVIARNSSFTYKNRTVDVRQIGRELGVRYVLEGSVRRVGSRVRFTAQLVDTATGNYVWGEKYDGEAEDLFDLQDRITEAIVGILEPTIQLAEIERTRRKRPENLGAYDYYLRALALTDAFTRDAVRAMLSNCLQAITLDPTFAPAYALAARTYMQRHIQGWDVDEPRERAEVLDLVERGLCADRLDPLMLGTAGQCFAWFAHDLAKGIAYIDEALSVNPNHAHAYLQSGIVRTRAGDTEVAIKHLNHARRLSPRDSRGYAIFHALALVHQVGGNLELARDWAHRAVQHNPNFLPGWTALASSAALMGRDAEAKAAAETLLGLDPQFSISLLVRRFPVVSDKFETYYEGLRRAGVPD